MKSNAPHILTGRWTRLSSDIEQAFYRIERENRWLGALVNGAIAGTAVGLIAWLVTTLREGDLLLFACLGSSAASVVFAPLAKTNSLRSIIEAYLVAGLVSALLLPVHHYQWLSLPLQCCLAVGVPIACMRLLDAMHPAAIGSALAFVLFDRDLKSLFFLLLAILGLLSIVKMLVYIYLEDLRFRDFGREFRRDYYGRELTVTVVHDETDEREAADR